MDIIDQNVVVAFCKTQELIGKKRGLNKKKIRDYLFRRIYQKWGIYIKNCINYNFFAFCFNRTYFWKNYLKNLLFFNENNFLLGKNILDVGCGAAPASIAVISLLTMAEKKQINVNLVDKSKRQIYIAKKLLNEMCINIESCKTCYFQFDTEVFNELVIFSYFICEQKENFIELLFINREKFPYGFVVIDYYENIKRIKKYFDEHNEKNIKVTIIKNRLTKEIMDYIGEDKVEVYGCYYQGKSKS